MTEGSGTSLFGAKLVYLDLYRASPEMTFLMLS